LQDQKENDQQIFPEAYFSFPGSKNISSFDKLWMCLYGKLKGLNIPDNYHFKTIL